MRKRESLATIGAQQGIWTGVTNQVAVTSNAPPDLRTELVDRDAMVRAVPLTHRTAARGCQCEHGRQPTLRTPTQLR
jgi:hypothetical protein